MSVSKIIGNFVKKKPLIFNSIIYGSFYTSAEFLQQAYKQREIATAKILVAEKSPAAIGLEKNYQQNAVEFKNQINSEIPSPDEGYDWHVLQRYVVYGYFLAGPILHGWYVWLDKFYVGTAGTTVIKKLFCDQFILTPPLIVLFFTSMSFMEGKRGFDILEECRIKFVKTFQTSCLYWLPVQFVNFLIVPPAFRVAFVSISAFLWVNILCHLKRVPISND